MSEDSGRTPDLSKIIGIIMENPDIIEKISRLAAGSRDEPSSTEEDSQKITETVSLSADDERKKRRSQLLYAIKPYVKSERAGAIDSVIAIADILDMMRRK